MNSSGTRRSVLYAFDCDQTLIHRDSDEAIAELGGSLPSEISSLFEGHTWIHYMNAVLNYLHHNGIQLSAITETLDSLSYVKGIPELMQWIFENSENSQMIVISDANSFGISRILSGLVPGDPLPSISLITNRASISPEGKLQLIPYHHQTHCPFCPQNLCKGDAISKFIKENGPFDQVVYIGDGKNDICPSMRLSKKDLVMAREGYSLQTFIDGALREGGKFSLKAKMKSWNTGFDILNYLNPIQE